MKQAKSIIKGGVFNIESTRVVRSSNDSGVQDDKSSKSSSVSSSVSTYSSSGSPRTVGESQTMSDKGNICDKNKTDNGINAAKTGGGVTTPATKLSKGMESTKKLRTAAKDNAAKALQQKAAVATASPALPAKDKIIAHQSELLEKPKGQAVSRSDKLSQKPASGSQASLLSASQNTAEVADSKSASKGAAVAVTKQAKSSKSDMTKASVQRPPSRQATGIGLKATPRNGNKKAPPPSAKTPSQPVTVQDNKSSTSAASKASTSAAAGGVAKSMHGNPAKKSPPPRPPSPQVTASSSLQVKASSISTQGANGAKKSPPPRPPSPSVTALNSSKTSQGKSTTASTPIVTSNSSTASAVPGPSVSRASAAKNSTPQAAKDSIKPVILPTKKSNSEPEMTPVTPQTSANPPQRKSPVQGSNNALQRSLSRDANSRRPQKSDNKQVTTAPAESAKVNPQSDTGPVSPIKKTEVISTFHDQNVSAKKVEPALERRPSVRQIVVKPAAETHGFTNPISTAAEYTGPVIQDPFESLRMQEQERLQNQGEKVDPKGKAVKQKQTSLGKKPGTASSTRLPSATKKSSSKAPKDARKASADRKSSRPKSAKSTKKASKKKKKGAETEKTTLSEQADQSNIAFVSGIGWHIETECFDKTNAKPVPICPVDSSDSDDEVQTMVVPNYEADEDDFIVPVDTLGSSLGRSKDVSTSLPGQTFADESSSENSASEADVSDIEVAENEVVFLENLETPRTTVEVISQTSKALSNSSKAISRERLVKPKKTPAFVPNPKPTKTSATPVVKMSTQPQKSSQEPHVKKAETSEQQQPQLRKSQDSAIPSEHTPVQSLRKSSSSGALSEEGRRRRSSADSNDETKSNKKTSKSQSQAHSEEAELDDIIEEIRKVTPHPSLTSSWKSLSKDTGRKAQRSMTREEFEVELRKSQGEKTFRQVPNKPTPVKTPAESAEILSSSGTLTDSCWSGGNSPKGELKPSPDQENEQLDKLVNAYRNMELKIKVDSTLTANSIKGKPPPAPKSAISPANRASQATEKSPRFVRKHDSFKEMHVLDSEKSEVSSQVFQLSEYRICMFFGLLCLDMAGIIMTFQSWPLYSRVVSIMQHQPCSV